MGKGQKVNWSTVTFSWFHKFREAAGLVGENSSQGLSHVDDYFTRYNILYIIMYAREH